MSTTGPKIAIHIAINAKECMYLSIRRLGAVANAAARARRPTTPVAPARDMLCSVRSANATYKDNAKRPKQRKCGSHCTVAYSMRSRVGCLAMPCEISTAAASSRGELHRLKNSHQNCQTTAFHSYRTAAYLTHPGQLQGKCQKTCAASRRILPPWHMPLWDTRAIDNCTLCGMRHNELSTCHEP